jgi:hypothetical protein
MPKGVYPKKTRTLALQDTRDAEKARVDGDRDARQAAVARLVEAADALLAVVDRKTDVVDRFKEALAAVRAEFGTKP